MLDMANLTASGAALFLYSTAGTPHVPEHTTDLHQLRGQKSKQKQNQEQQLGKSVLDDWHDIMGVPANSPKTAMTYSERHP